MEFKQIEFPTMGVTVPMLKDDKHGLLCTNPVLIQTLGTTRTTLETIRLKHGHRLPTIKYEKSYFIGLPKAELGLERIGANTVLWPLKSMLGVAFHLHTDQAWEFHQEAIRLLEATIRESTITAAQYAELAARVAQLEGRPHLYVVK